MRGRGGEEGEGGGRKGGGRREKRGREEGEEGREEGEGGGEKGGRGKEDFARAKRAPLQKGGGETRGREEEVRGRMGERPTTLSTPSNNFHSTRTGLKLKYSHDRKTLTSKMLSSTTEVFDRYIYFTEKVS